MDIDEFEKRLKQMGKSMILGDSDDDDLPSFKNRSGAKSKYPHSRL